MTQWIITSSVLIVIIAVLRFVLRGKISLKLQYALWGLVLIRLLLPFSVFESPASVLNLLQKREETVAPPAIYEPYEPETVTPVTPAVPDEDIFILDDNIEHIEPETNITVNDEGFVTEPEIRVISAKDILIPLWIGGIAVFGAVFAVSNLRFRKKLKNTREYLSETKAWIPVYKSSAVKTPCLFGAIKPAIYVTEEVLKDEKTICHVLEHETTHYRHGDHIWSVLRCFCLALHWYNPLVWLAAFLSMRDSELACDEDTIKRIGEDERIGYGRTLINLTCEKPAVGILSAATTMTGSKSSIKERILLIAKKPKMLWITAVLVAVVAIFAVGCTFTGAKDASEMKEDKKVVVESSIEGNENIVPVLYYEKGVGGPSYKTNTLLINDNKAFIMENHNRTFERTYPSSAYERFKENEAVYGEYGQLMVYYNSVFGEIFLFESYDERVFTIVKNNIKTEINFNEGETYFDFLYFDGNYYLFTLTETSVLRTYKISENLEVEKPFDFKYGNLDIDETVFIDNSVVIVGNNLVLTSEKDLFICNFETNVTKVLPMDYSVFGMVADKDCFYVISYSDLGEIVFEKFSTEGESLGKNEIFLPSGFNYSPWISRTDGTYYMYGSEIYMEFHTGGECYIFSYDVESEEWKNSWIVGKEKEPFSASNIKYIVMSGETYYDIFPYWSNRENNNINNDVVSEEEKETVESAPVAVDYLTKTYYEFLGSSFGELLSEDGSDFTKQQMAYFTFHKTADPESDPYGVESEEIFNAAAEEFFGERGKNLLSDKNINYKVDENGMVVVKGGYSPSPNMFVLKEREELSDGTVKAILYIVYYDFAMELPEGKSVEDLLFSGQLDYFGGAGLAEVVLKEKKSIDKEIGEQLFSAEILSAKILGEAESENGIYPVFYRLPKDFYSKYYTFEIPEFPEADRTKYGVYEELGWCINDNAYNQNKPWQQLFVNDKTATELAEAIMFIDSSELRQYDFNEFENISEANNQYLLHAAISSTPGARFGTYSYTYDGNGNPVASFPEPENIVAKVCTYAFEEYELSPLDIFYAEDVEKTFRWLFGEEAEFNPESIYNQGYRYSPEGEIFLSFFDMMLSPITGRPQILDYSVDDDIYTVNAVLLSAFEYEEDGTLKAEIGRDYILKQQAYTYSFKKAEDGHFVLLGIKKAQAYSEDSGFDSDLEEWVRNLKVTQNYKTDKPFPAAVGAVFNAIVNSEGIKYIDFKDVEVYGDEREFFAAYTYIERGGEEQVLQVRMRKTADGYGLLARGGGPIGYGLEKTDITVANINLFDIPHMSPVVGGLSVTLGTNGKYGLYKSDGTLAADFVYDSYDYCGSIIVLGKENTKTRKYITVEHSRVTGIGEKASNEYYFYHYKTGELITDKYGEEYYYTETDIRSPLTDWHDAFRFCENGNYYEYQYFTGYNRDEVRMTEFHRAGTIGKTLNGLEITRYHYGPYKESIRYGISTKKDTEIIPPIYTSIEAPFEDRFVARHDDMMVTHTTRIYDLKGRVVCDKYDVINFSLFNGGSYVGVAECVGAESQAGTVCFDENGKEMPKGLWFIDKDGNAVSERFDYSGWSTKVLHEYDKITVRDFVTNKDKQVSVMPYCIKNYETNLSKLKKAKKGDTVNFGYYHGETEWIVLEKEGDKLLLISKLSLDNKKFNDEYDENVTWKTSTLRAWLNDEFMYEAFSQTERNLLVETTTTRNGAKDKVSLLSYSEAEKYFSTRIARKTMPSEYAVQKVDYVPTESGGNTWFWLREGKAELTTSGRVNADGTLFDWCGMDNPGFIRPIVWVDTSKI